MHLSKLYEKDELLWYEENAKLIRQKKFDKLDYPHIAEALETMGKREIQTIRSQFSLLFMHLLKWIYQPDFQCRSWKNTIFRERRNIEKMLKYYPSLKGHLSEIIEEAYEDARIDAAAETNLEMKIFPKKMPFKVEQALKKDWLPK